MGLLPRMGNVTENGEVNVRRPNKDEPSIRVQNVPVKVRSRFLGVVVLEHMLEDVLLVVRFSLLR